MRNFCKLAYYPTAGYRGIVVFGLKRIKLQLGPPDAFFYDLIQKINTISISKSIF